MNNNSNRNKNRKMYVHTSRRWHIQCTNLLFQQINIIIVCAEHKLYMLIEQNVSYSKTHTRVSIHILNCWLFEFWSRSLVNESNKILDVAIYSFSFIGDATKILKRMCFKYWFHSPTSICKKFVLIDLSVQHKSNVQSNIFSSFIT